MALHMEDLHDEYWDAGWRIGLIDINMDDELSATYDRSFPC